MNPSTSVIVKYECVVAAISLGAAIVQWNKVGWGSALFIFTWIFVVINIPVLWYVGKASVSDWLKRRGRM